MQPCLFLVDVKGKIKDDIKYFEYRHDEFRKVNFDVNRLVHTIFYQNNCIIIILSNMIIQLLFIRIQCPDVYWYVHYSLLSISAMNPKKLYTFITPLILKYSFQYILHNKIQNIRQKF